MYRTTPASRVLEVSPEPRGAPFILVVVGAVFVASGPSVAISGVVSRGPTGMAPTLLFGAVFAFAGGFVLREGLRRLAARVRFTVTEASTEVGWLRGSEQLRTEKFGAGELMDVVVEQKDGEPPGIKWRAVGGVQIRVRQEILYRLVLETQRGPIPLTVDFQSTNASAYDEKREELRSFLGLTAR